MKNKVPEYKSKRGWQINPEKLQEACDFLGIKKAVVVKFSSGRRTAGTHRSKISKAGIYYHGVTLSHRFEQEFANETLWHELVHCMQAEQIDPITDFHSVYRQAKGPHGVAFFRNKYEVEAREVAAAAAPERMLLIMPDKYGFNVLGSRGFECIEVGCDAKGMGFEWPDDRRAAHHLMHHPDEAKIKRNRRTKDQIERDALEKRKKIEAGEIVVIGFHIDGDNMRVQNCRMCHLPFKQERKRGRPRLECDNCKVEL